MAIMLVVICPCNTPHRVRNYTRRECLQPLSPANGRSFLRQAHPMMVSARMDHLYSLTCMGHLPIRGIPELYELLVNDLLLYLLHGKVELALADGIAIIGRVFCVSSCSQKNSVHVKKN